MRKASGIALVSSRHAQICLAIILMVAAAPPALSARTPQNQEQLSQAGTKSMLTSDPCASFRKSLSAVPVSGPETNKDGDLSPASQPSQTRVRVSISPQTDIRLAAGYSVRLATTVTGATNTAVEWTVAGPGCSGPACGSIEGDVYLAPSTAPTPPIVRLTATSKADSRASDSTTVCLVQPERQWRRLSATESINAAARETAPNNSAVVGYRNDTADLKPYVELLKKRVEENWYKRVPKSARGPELEQGNVTIECSIERSGRITEETIASTSGNAELDKAALTALRKTKLPPFPSTIRADHFTMRFHFEYNSSSHLSKISE
jgi:TonB family protein